MGQQENYFYRGGSGGRPDATCGLLVPSQLHAPYCLPPASFFPWLKSAFHSLAVLSAPSRAPNKERLKAGSGSGGRAKPLELREILSDISVRLKPGLFPGFVESGSRLSGCFVLCKSVCLKASYPHQDGRVVKALDLRSNGRMSAWVRTPLLVVGFFHPALIKLKMKASKTCGSHPVKLQPLNGSRGFRSARENGAAGGASPRCFRGCAA